ncbi:MAG: hypothetical protein HC877_07990 [Thioploca sp.]|nr:hypothetical protein [Thioploca sp.]
MDEIIGFFKDTLEKFVIDDLQKYLTCNSYPNKFYIFSDYCLHDKNKTHDVLTCTIMPYSLNINAEKAIISSIASQENM